MSRAALLGVCVAMAACASATSPLEGQVDAGRDGTVTPDAAMDSSVPCTVMTTQLLTNPAFEATPEGTGWTEVRIENEPIVRSDGTIPSHTPPTKAWLGGVAANPFISSHVNDGLRQDVTVPAMTTELTLTGQYEIRSAETANDDYDHVQVDLVQAQTAETVIQSVLAADNRMKTTMWMPLNATFTMPLSGQTVRLRFTSSNDISNASSFYFDSLALTATHCQ